MTSRFWLFLTVGVVLLVAAGAIVYVSQKDDTIPGTAAVSTDLYLESMDSAGVSPFTTTVAAVLPTTAPSLPQPSVSPPIRPTTTAASPSASVATSAPAPPAPPAGQPSVLPISGATPGLYGGTGDVATCDRNQMALFLMSTPDKANAWVAALNSDPTLRWSGGNQVAASQIPQYLNELTPVRLLADTRVTNNGYSGGRPTPFQSVLQAGTAVFVDQYGVPRVRCACGNPLLRSIALTSPPVNQGTPWDGYGHSVTITQSTTIINDYTVININNGTTINMPSGGGLVPVPGAPVTVTATPAPVTVTAPPVTVTETAPCPTPVTSQPSQTGGPVTPPFQTSQPSQPSTAQPTAGTGLTVPPTVALGTGDVQATLLWNNGSDLDLHVTDPTGTDIYYSNKTSPSGGQLDYDNIPGCGSAPDTHVENIFWPTGGAPNGPYKVYVVDFSECGSSSSFNLKVTVGGQVVYNQDLALTASGQQSTPFEFTR